MSIEPMSLAGLTDRAHVWLTGEHIQPSNLALLNVSAAATTVGTVMEWLPAISAVFGLVLFLIQIVDKISQVVERRKKAALDRKIEAKNAGVPPE